MKAKEFGEPVMSQTRQEERGMYYFWNANEWQRDRVSLDCLEWMAYFKKCTDIFHRVERVHSELRAFTSCCAADTKRIANSEYSIARAPAIAQVKC